MQEKECKPITTEFIEKFMMEAQHRSGLPFFNPISVYYANGLSMISAPDSMLDTIMDKFINNYMIITHTLYHRNKTWKSYDW